MARSRSDSPSLFDLPVRPDFSAELSARQRGQWPVAGTDEAGRGPLAGPVVAAAVILDPGNIPPGWMIPNVCRRSSAKLFIS
jgi:ribonuclease HII